MDVFGRVESHAVLLDVRAAGVHRADVNAREGGALREEPIGDALRSVVRERSDRGFRISRLGRRVGADWITRGGDVTRGRRGGGREARDREGRGGGGSPPSLVVSRTRRGGAADAAAATGEVERARAASIAGRCEGRLARAADAIASKVLARCLHIVSVVSVGEGPNLTASRCYFRSIFVSPSERIHKSKYDPDRDACGVNGY